MKKTAIGIGLIGCGTVGGGVVRLLRDRADLYERRIGRRLDIRRILVRDAVAAREGVDGSLLTDDAESFFGDDRIDIVVEVAGGRAAVGDYVRRALESGRHVVTANKSLLAADGIALFALARQRGVSIAFEASCAGGIPCLTALQFGLMANEHGGLYGILNGTCNYILTEMTRSGKTYAAALAEAQEKGYAEADPALDVGGQDTAQKLAILAALAFGVQIDEGSIAVEGIENLSLDDVRFGAELGYDVKLLAIAEADPSSGAISAAVQPCFLHDSELLAQVGGAFNALSVHGHAVGHTMYYGAGAGRMPTASAVVSDVLNVASGWYPTAFAQMFLTPDAHAPARIVPPAELRSRFYLRLSAVDRPGVMAAVTRILGDRGISISAVLQHETKADRHVPVVVTTHAARAGDVSAAVVEIEKLDEIAAAPVVIRIVDLPQ